MSDGFFEQSWRWSVLAARPILLTNDGRVVLAGAFQAAVVTRDIDTGKLRDIEPSDRVAKIIAAAPDVHRLALALIHGVDIGMVRIESTAAARSDGAEATEIAHGTVAKLVDELRAALAKAGA